MAHWIIEDRGFGGTDFTCSECKDVFNDIYHRICSDGPCPNCGAVMNEDEAVYLDDTRERGAEKMDKIQALSPQQGMELNEAMTNVRLPTNDEAATVLENMAEIIGLSQGRGSGKSLTIAYQVDALLRGAHALRMTPDNVRRD